MGRGVSTNPILLTAAIILLFAGSKSWHFALDRYLVPALRWRRGTAGAHPAGRRRRRDGRALAPA